MSALRAPREEQRHPYPNTSRPDAGRADTANPGRRNDTETSPTAPLTRDQLDDYRYAVACDRALQPLTVRALLLIEAHYNLGLGLSWPSQDTLAGDLGTTRNRVSVAIRQAREAGYLAPVRRGRGHAYRLLPQASPRSRRRGLALVAAPPTERPVATLDVPEPARQEAPIRAPRHVPEPARQTASAPLDVPERERVPVPEPAPRTPYVNPGPGKTVTGTTSSSRSRATARTAAAAEKTPIPADWAPSDEAVAQAVAAFPMSEPEVRFEVAAMRRYFLARPGEKRPGWDATWDKWIKRAAGGPPTGQRSGGRSSALSNAGPSRSGPEEWRNAYGFVTDEVELPPGLTLPQRGYATT